MTDRKSIIARIADLYIDGFREMTLGRTLWAIIIVKLLLVLGLLKLFFFPDILKERAAGREADYVSRQLEERTISD